MEIVDTVASYMDQQQYDEDFDQEPQGRGKVQDIVHCPGIEHRHHGHDDDQQPRVVHDSSDASDADYNTEEDGDTTQNRDRSALQFACVRIVHDVFQQGDLDQAGMYPADKEQGDEERNKNAVKRRHIFDLCGI